MRSRKETYMVGRGGRKDLGGVEKSRNCKQVILYKTKVYFQYNGEKAKNILGP